MRDFDSSYEAGGADRDHQPFTYWGGHPMYAATLLVLMHVATLLLCTLATALHKVPLLARFEFHSELVLRLWLWQPFTYAFVHEPSSVGAVAWFFIGMYFLWVFGRELERFFGRRLFLQFYAITWLLLPALHMGLAWLEPQHLAGTSEIHFAVFLAFATLYPNAQMIFGITARWWATIFVAAQAIVYLATGAWFYLLVFGLVVAWAHYFVRYQKGEVTLPSFRFRWPRRKPKFHVVPRPAPPVQKVKLTQQPAGMDDVDALLDKIARSGLNSLSAAERARLERASADLNERTEPH